jgi:hypothetical protein
LFKQPHSFSILLKSHQQLALLPHFNCMAFETVYLIHQQAIARVRIRSLLVEDSEK